MAIVITKQPESVITPVGRAVTFYVVATGSNLSYQWQYQGTSSETWNNFQSAASAMMTKTPLASWDGWKVRCVITDGTDTATSNTATITIRDVTPDKLVDSTQLDSDLTAVANAIRTKTGGSGQLSFPSGFVSGIGGINGGGGGSATLVEKSINANGTYNASGDSADGYSKVTVNVPDPEDYTLAIAALG